jgi:hypothetical protein
MLVGVLSPPSYFWILFPVLVVVFVINPTDERTDRSDIPTDVFHRRTRRNSAALRARFRMLGTARFPLESCGIAVVMIDKPAEYTLSTDRAYGLRRRCDRKLVTSSREDDNRAA